MEDRTQYRWIMSSALQKSIRRGLVEPAANCAAYLWETDRNYLCYRLGVIIAEDVGIADVELTQRYLSTRIAKSKIDEAGGLEFVLEIVKDACDSVKDRTSCDAAYVASFIPMPILSGSFDEMEAQASHTALDRTIRIYDRINSLWLLLGGKKFKRDDEFPLNYPNDSKGRIKDDVDRAKKVVESIMPGIGLASAFENAWISHAENIALGFPFSAEALCNGTAKSDDSTIGRVVRKSFVGDPLAIHAGTGISIPAAAIDGHVSEGKKALFSYLESSAFGKELNSMRIPESDKLGIMKHCLFRIEGHEVDKRIYYPLAVDVMRDCERIPLSSKSDGKADFSVLSEIMKSEFHLIEEARLKSFKRNFPRKTVN